MLIFEVQREKSALLKDFGFMNQHTDPPLVESVVRELRDWTRQTESQFLVDVAQGQLTYYHSPRHFETPRAKDGKNPPIFSVVRALIKVFQ